MQMVAILWLVYRLSGSPLNLGLVAVARQVANFTVSPLAGVLADRLPKNRVIALTQAAMMTGAGLLAWATLSGRVAVWHIIGFQLVMGLVAGVDMPVRNALLYDLIDDKRVLGNAIALHSALINVGRIIGPVIAGFVIARTGEGICFVVNAVSYAGVVAVLALMPCSAGASVAGSRRSVRGDLTDGVRYAFGSDAMRALLVLTALMGLFGVSYRALLPVFVKDIFERGSEYMGYLNTAVAIGAIAGTALLASKKGMRGLETRVFAAVLVFGLCVSGFALSRNLLLSYLLLMGIGLGQVTVFASSKTMLQSIAARGMHGRVISLYIGLFMGAVTIGGLVLGGAAQAFGAPAALACAGAGCVCAGMYFGLRLPSVREAVEDHARAEVEAVAEPVAPSIP